MYSMHMANHQLVMLCPSRSRPGNIAELRTLWPAVTSEAALVVAVDEDDPDLPAYQRDGDVRVMTAGLGLGAILNKLAAELAPSCTAIGFLGDDHRPRTHDWDRRLLDVLRERPGIAYGNDLNKGEQLPTAVVISAPVITALGYLCPPGVRHLYLDDFWLQLGHSLDSVHYCPDVIIEHMHPDVGKAEWDDGYRRVNSGEQYAADNPAYLRFLAESWPADLARVLAVFR